MTTYPALSDLVKTMAGMPSTNNWDVVVSYNVQQLNNFLQAQYDAAKLAKNISIDSGEKEDPLTGNKFHVVYKIHFASPVLSFVAGVSGLAILTMPIIDESNYQVFLSDSTTPTKTGTIPNNTYSIKATVPLAAIIGDTQELASVGQALTFSDSEAQKGSVVIHFKNEKGTSFQIQPNPSTQEQDILNTYFMPALRTYFQTNVGEIDYELANVNNQKPTQGVQILTPKSFVFASGGEANDGVLSLYIQTVESANPPGNLAPSFQPGDAATLPIPKDYTASIILSYNLVTQKVLLPRFQDNQFTVDFVTDGKGDQGIHAKLKKDQSIIAPNDRGMYIFGSHDYQGLNISLNDHPLDYKLTSDGTCLTWGGSTDSEWSQITSGGFLGQQQWGKVTVNISLEKKSSGTVTQSEITLGAISVGRSDFKVLTSPKECTFAEKLIGCRESAPDYYNSDMTLQIPNINSAEIHIDFFRTTNLLAPSQHVIDIATNQGIHVPHDLLIIGNVAKYQ